MHFFQLRTALPGVYCRVLSVLSDEIILLVRQRELALELCRLSNIDDREKVSLETVRILYLPALTSRASVLLAFCPDEHPGDVLFSKNHRHHRSLHPHPHLSSSSMSEGGIDTRRHLHSVPMDSIVAVPLHITTTSGHWRRSRMFDIIVRRRTLLEFSDVQAQAGAAGTGTGAGVGTALAVPWEKWGPNKTRILDHDSFLCGGSVTGERRAMVRWAHIIIRDYNPFRVQRALKLLGGAEEVTLESGSVVKVVKEPSVYRAGEWFRDDIETGLSYVETAVPFDGRSEILMDQDNIVVVPQLVRTGPMEVSLVNVYCVDKMTD